MGNNKHAKVTLIIVATAIAVISLFAATMMIAPQQVNALSIYDPEAANPDPGNIAKPVPYLPQPQLHLLSQLQTVLWTRLKAFNLSYHVLGQSSCILKTDYFLFFQ
jgi:hypothetical protein